MEQEDEIKQLNQVGRKCRCVDDQPLKNINIPVHNNKPVFVWSSQLILGAQCQANRDYQIQEKKQIRMELTEEERRLDNMMEVERRKALETLDKIEELRRQQRIK